MQVNCPACGSEVLSEDMNLTNLVAKCRQCNALVDLRPLLPTREAVAETPKVRTKVPMPAGMYVDEGDPGLTIVRRWFTPMFLFLALFCVVWDGFLVFWYSTVMEVNAPWFAILFPLLHVAVGVGLTYYTLAGFVNSTTIRVDSELLTIRHGPLPSPGNRTLPTDTLEQLYTQQEVHQGKRVTISYKVCAATKDGHKVVLVSNLPDVDQALFIEQRVENYLGIKDRPMPGEVSR